MTWVNFLSAHSPQVAQFSVDVNNYSWQMILRTRISR